MKQMFVSIVDWKKKNHNLTIQSYVLGRQDQECRFLNKFEPRHLRCCAPNHYTTLYLFGQ